MEVNYSVTIEDFAERYYIKSFQKKYKAAWETTICSVVAGLARIDMLLQTDKADLIKEVDGIKIIKTDFRVFGTKESPKTSGNRCIIAVDEKRKKVSILLVYTKTDIKGSNETVWWKKLVSDAYTDYKWVLN
jgi:hypothetical protein